MVNRSLKQFYTHNYDVLRSFLAAYPVNAKIVIDPFAGARHLLRLFNRPTLAIDIDPDVEPDVVGNSFERIPRFDNALIVTNPPYCHRHVLQKQDPELYARVVAAGYTDLYEYALRRVIDQLWPVPIFTLLPENFIASRTTKLRGELYQHIKAVQIHTTTTCNDTGQPTVMVYLTPDEVQQADLWIDHKRKTEIVINKNGFRPNIRPHGNHVDFGLRANQSEECRDTSILLQAVDGGSEKNRIKLMRVYERYQTRHSAEKTRTYVQVVPHFPLTKRQIRLLIKCFNRWVDNWRESTHGLGLTSFRNNTSSGFRRKRLDFKLARDVINRIIELIIADD